MASFPIPAPAFNGNSRVVPPGNAFDWLRQGWALFAANPGLWIGLTIVLLVIVLGVQIVPLVGTLAAHLLMPVLGAGLLLVCRKIDEEERVQIDDLFAGFKQNAGPLVMVGVLYMVAMFAIMIIPQRRRDKKVKDMLSSLKAGDRVRTIGGIYGTIVDVDADNNVATIESARTRSPIPIARGR